MHRAILEKDVYRGEFFGYSPDYSDENPTPPNLYEYLQVPGRYAKLLFVGDDEVKADLAQSRNQRLFADTARLLSREVHEPA